MKKFYLLPLLIFIVPVIGFSQDINDEITLIQAEFEMSKKQLVEAYMDLPESIAPGFWSVYQDYEMERQMLARERILIINDYLNSHDNLSEDEAENLASRTLKNDLGLAKLRKSYYKKFTKATSAKDAARFLQVDIYIHNTIRNLLQEDLPFIDKN